MSLTAFCGQALAQQESLGEQGFFLSCVYECKESKLPRRWDEVTTLMLANLRTPEATDAIVRIAILNGNMEIIAKTFVGMGSEDLDEINVCRTLEAGGVPAPQAGLIEVFVRHASAPEIPAIGVYGWTKNLLGRFDKSVDEPFDRKNRVSGLAKTECRLVPPSVDFGQLGDQFARSSAPDIPAVLIEDTGND